MKSWDAAVARGFRARANALVPVLDFIERESRTDESFFAGEAADAYERRRKQVVVAIGRLIDAYNRCARAMENPTGGDSKFSAGKALAEVRDIEGDLERIMSVPMPSLKSNPVTTSHARVTPPAMTARELITFKIPSRPAANGVPAGMTNTQFKRIIANSIKESTNDTTAAAILWASKKLGVPYSRENRQRPGFFDCSSFIASAFESSGVPMREGDMLFDTGDMIAGFSREDSSLVPVAGDEAKPGDLLFYQRSPGRGEPAITHVVMLLSGGYIMHAPNTGAVTRIERINQSTAPIAVRRVVKP